MESIKAVSLEQEAKGATRDEKKRQYGCVIRAIESALEAPATEEQWDSRLNFVLNAAANIPGDVIRQYRSPDTLEELKRWLEALERDYLWVSNFVNGLYRSNTPLGDAIRRYHLSEQALLRDQLIEASENGSRILVATTNHMAHIQYNPSKNHFISLSDRFTQMSIHPEAKYPTYLLDPKD